VDYLAITGWKWREIERGLHCYGIFSTFSLYSTTLSARLSFKHLSMAKPSIYDLPINTVVDIVTDFCRNQFIFNCL
jgi:hypothetical protein